MIRYVIAILFLVVLVSCKDKVVLHYEPNKKLYQNAVNCLIEKYNVVFNEEQGLVQGISIYKDDLERYGVCSNVLSLFGKENISFVNYERDSTITFHSNTSNNLKAKQYMLMYVKDKKRLSEKMSKNLYIKEARNENWYELEKVISLAD